MYHYYGYRGSLSQRIARTFAELFLVVIGVVILLAAPILQSHILQKDYNQLEDALQIFCTRQDFWNAPKLPEEATDIKIDEFKRTFIQVYDVKVSSKYHTYEGEIHFGEFRSSIKDTTNGEMLHALKIMEYVGFACIVANLTWYGINHMLRLNRTFITLFEDFRDWIRPHLNI